MRFFGFLALVAIPGSLFTAGASVPTGLVALCGLALVLAGVRADADLRRLFAVLAACYAALLATDILNGGGIVNFQFTALNYLPLLATVGVAHVLRRARPAEWTIVSALCAMAWIAAGISLFRSLVLEVYRPGGLYMNPIPYAFVVAMWGTLLLSWALRARRHRALLLLSAVIAVVPVVLAESKIVWVAMAASYAVVGVGWAAETGRWRSLGVAALATVVILVVAYQTVAWRRLGLFFDELVAFVTTGDLSGISFGTRTLAAAAGLRAFWDGPWLGYGFDQVFAAAMAHADPAAPDISYLAHLHNDYVTHLVAYGWIGGAFILVFLGILFWLARSSGDPVRRGAGYGLLVMAVIYMAGEILLNIEPITAPLAMMMAILTMRPLGPPQRLPSSAIASKP